MLNKLIRRLLLRVFSKRIRIFGYSRKISIQEWEHYSKQIKRKIIYSIAKKLEQEGFIELKADEFTEYLDSSTTTIRAKIICLK